MNYTQQLIVDLFLGLRTDKEKFEVLSEIREHTERWYEYAGHPWIRKALEAEHEKRNKGPINCS